MSTTKEMAQMLQGVSVVWLPVTDIDRAVGFYEGTLGLSVRSKQEQWAELDAGEITIGLNGREEETPGGDGGAVVAFRVAGDIDAEVERLASQGVTFPGGVSDHPWGKVAPFKDPDGNDLQLYEAPQG